VADHRSLDPGARLRTAREAKGLSQRQVADATKLSVRAVDSLERDCLRELPAGIYRRSIVKAVAREVGVNADQLLNEFIALHPDDLPSMPAAATVETKASASHQRVFALFSAALPLIGGVLYLAAPLARPAVHDAPAPKAIVKEQHVLPVTAEVVPVGGFVRVAETSTRPAPVVVTLTISSRCQLRVVADGNEIVGRTMEQGETLPIELGDELLLLGDNASAVQFSINGQAGRMFGEPGDVLSARIGRDDYQDFLVRY
jgi:transcriptional regulator with XRE-family HTH domain